MVSGGEVAEAQLPPNEETLRQLVADPGVLHLLDLQRQSITAGFKEHQAAALAAKEKELRAEFDSALDLDRAIRTPDVPASLSEAEVRGIVRAELSAYFQSNPGPAMPPAPAQTGAFPVRNYIPSNRRW